MIKPVQQNMYPTSNTLEEVWVYAKELFPNVNHNELYALLMTYHNTLLKELSDIK